jgi:nicotinamidase/pyrazinamidase
VITYDSTIALVVVDLQRDFADPKGSHFVEGAELVVPRANIEIMRAQSAGALIVYTQDSRPEHGWGAELHPGLQVSGPVVGKGASEEGVTKQLRALFDDRAIERVVVIGLALDGAVKATALETARSHATSVIPEATAAAEHEPADAGRAIEEMRTAGVTIV